ncbi:MAG: PDZ domain-containing protein [Byssovorax sp.]
MKLALAPLGRALLGLTSALVLLGCPAVYPELGTRTRPLPAGQPLDPPPPQELRWIRFLSGTVPEHTRDGRTWQKNGKLADPYAKLIVGGKELLRTPVQHDTLSPTWPGSPSGNFKVGPDDKFRVELWDSNTLNDSPICVQEVRAIAEDQLVEKKIRFSCDSGAEVILAFEDAHAIKGAGLWYELRTDSCFVTRMLDGSPAQRAGLEAGDQILQLGGKSVSAMSSDEVRSVFNAIPVDGLSVQAKHATGTTVSLILKEGPIYPLFEQQPVD